MFLTAKHVISAITEIVNAGSAEIIDIIEKYEEELRLAKEEIDRQRQLLAAAVPQQTILTADVRCEIQHSDSVHFSVCKKEILPVQLQEEESDSSDSQFTVYPVSIASLRFEELTECQQTDKEDNLCSCHEEESGGPGEAHSFPQIDIDQMREDEKPKSSPGQAAANMMMDNPEIQLEEERNEEELISSSNIDKCSQNTQADTEDHTMSSTSSPSFKNLSIPLHHIQLMENSSGDCRPSSPAQQMKETSQDSRDDQGGQQSNQNKMMDDPEIQQEEEEMSSSSAIGDTCSQTSHNTQADPEDHTMSSTSSPGFKNLSIPLHRIQLMKKSGDCRPSSPAQQMKEITQEALNATEGRPQCSLRSNLNQYNCLVCGKAFKYCVSMKSHMKRKHAEEEKPHQNQCNCHVCEKGSKHRRSMDCTWIDQMREDEEPKSSPGQTAANMDNPEIQQEEKELSSSSAIDDTCSQNTQADPEDCPSLRNLSMPLHGIQLMENSSGDCRPSSPAQQMKETREALNATEGCQLLSPHLLVAPSQDGRDNQGGQQSNQNQYNCLVCGKGFVHRSSMERHMRSKHTEEMPHQNQCNCHVCQKGPKHRRSMNRQMDCTWIDQMREDEEPKSSPGKAAANMMMENPEILQEEMSSSSAIDDMCSQNTQADPENHTKGSTSSPSFKNLSIPLHRIQLKEKSGGDCGPSSPAQQMKEITQEALNATEGSPLRSPHLLVAPSQDSRDNQGGQQPNQNHYYCQFCGKGFKYHRNMKMHVKSNHKGEKPLNQFYCSFCGKRFEYRRNVKRHMKSHHTGLKRFCCKVCGKVFKCLSTLRRHMRGNRTHT